MDATDVLSPVGHDGAVVGNDNDDDGAPTVEETYEVTTTKRKTVRTSYKIQEVSKYQSVGDPRDAKTPLEADPRDAASALPFDPKCFSVHCLIYRLMPSNLPDIFQCAKTAINSGKYLQNFFGFNYGFNSRHRRFLTESPVLPQEQSDEMTFEESKEFKELEGDGQTKRQNETFETPPSYDIVIESTDNYVNDLRSKDHENGNRQLENDSNIQTIESNRENRTNFACLDNTNVFTSKDREGNKTVLLGKENFEDSQTRNTCCRQETRHSAEQREENPAQFSRQTDRNNPYSSSSTTCTSTSTVQSDPNEECNLVHRTSIISNSENQRPRSQGNEKCQKLLERTSQTSQVYRQNDKFPPKRIDDVKYKNLRSSRMSSSSSSSENFEVVVIPSENAAQPCEIAHAPEGASGTRSIETSCSFGSVAAATSSPVDDSSSSSTIVLRDTAAILQELALQRLSGGISVGELSVPPRRKYETDGSRDRRSFDSEIGREIVRERKMRQELDCARGKSEEPPAPGTQHLPPCLRARHARATRAALSRSLDEAKFNKITGADAALPTKQTTEDPQRGSTPNVVGVGSNSSTSTSEKIHAKTLAGLNLGDPQCRERIEKYKEERRTFLRDKYRSESLRGTTTSSSSSKVEDDSEQALLTRLKQRASRPSLR